MPTEAQLERQRQTRAALVERCRKLAKQAHGPGLSIGVRGNELEAVLAALDEATARADACDAALSVAPKKGVKAKDDPRLVAAREVIAEAHVILSGQSALWGQPLLAALSDKCTDENRDVPAEWRAVIGESVAVTA